MLWFLRVTGLAEGVHLNDYATVTFADLELGRKILTNRDEFIAALSPFDRAARLHKDRQVSEPEFLQWLARSVLAWKDGEADRVSVALAAAAKKIRPWDLPFPPVLLIETTGQEEGHAAYTRQRAVILPKGELNSPPADLERLLVHEFFHILSRQNPKLRRSLYAIIGFSEINDIRLPAAFDQRRITNPDGVHNRWVLNLTQGTEGVCVVPILYASTERYDAQKGGEFFNYLIFKLLAVEKIGKDWSPRQRDGQLVWLDPKTTPGFQMQIGENTSYVIHPDEILADNFVLLMNSETNVPTPGILARMSALLKAANRTAAALAE